jgi:hypothetical protein
MTADPRVKVVYILGWVRSGSTLLDTLLGELEGFFSCGELRYLWDRGLIKGWMCGCGSPLPQCEVWSRILERAFEEGSPVPAREIARKHLNVVRTRRLPRVLYQSPGARFNWPELESYTETLQRLYLAIGEATGSRVLVDSSKFAQDAALLRLLPAVDAYYVHLVRDPRAVAHSNLRKKTSQPDPLEPVEMALWSPAQTAARWSRFNLAAEAVRARHRRGASIRLRYEDLIEHPAEALERILRMLGEEHNGLAFVEDHVVEFNENHTVWGNPSRFKRGKVELRLDDEWLDKLENRARLVSTLVCAPLLLRYGYPIAGRKASRNAEGKS